MPRHHAQERTARSRAGPSRDPEAARGPVRRPARSGTFGLHRRDLSFDQQDSHPRPRLPWRTSARGRGAQLRKTTTFIAGRTTRGMMAPFVLAVPINRIAFKTYVERVRSPELRKGDIVVMGNLFNHKGMRTRHGDRGGGCEPPLSAALPAIHAEDGNAASGAFIPSPRRPGWSTSSRREPVGARLIDDGSCCRP